MFKIYRIESETSKWFINQLIKQEFCNKYGNGNRYRFMQYAGKLLQY